MLKTKMIPAAFPPSGGWGGDAFLRGVKKPSKAGWKRRSRIGEGERLGGSHGAGGRHGVGTKREHRAWPRQVCPPQISGVSSEMQVLPLVHAFT